MWVRLPCVGSGGFCGVQPLLATNRSRIARPLWMLSEMPWIPKYAKGRAPPLHPLIGPGAAIAATARKVVGRAHASA
jgi:hypothetical protein